MIDQCQISLTSEVGAYIPENTLAHDNHHAVVHQCVHCHSVRRGGEKCGGIDGGRCRDGAGS